MPLINQTNAYKCTQLTAPGVGDKRVDIIGGASSLALEVVVASINTSVTVQLEYSDDPTFATGLYVTPLTITANGNYIIAGVPAKRFARANFTAEAGGTAATVDFNFNLYN